MKKTQKGFTLVELLVVIAILAILSTVAVVGYTSFINRAEKQAAETEMAQIETVIDNAFVINDEVTVKVDGKILKLTQGDDGIVAAETDKQLEDADITEDLGEVVEKLYWADGVLTYKYESDSTDEKLVKDLTTK